MQSDVRSNQSRLIPGPNRPQAPIGVFDSGLGGLTVLKVMHRHLPQERILYFGDTAHVPYGDRTPGEILTLVRAILTWMESQGVKMVLMACNTSSALVLEQVQQEFTFPILGLIWPGARAAAQQGQRIGVIATLATVASDAYGQAIREIAPQAQVYQVGCPQFVPLIEAGRIQDPQTEAIAIQYLQPLQKAGIDTLIYGCTHYPHLAPVVEPLLGPGVTTVDPAVHLVAAAEKELALLRLKNTTGPGETHYYVSGDPQTFSDRAIPLLGYAPPVAQAHLLPQPLRA